MISQGKPTVGKVPIWHKEQGDDIALRGVCDVIEDATVEVTVRGTVSEVTIVDDKMVVDAAHMAFYLQEGDVQCDHLSPKIKSMG